MLRGPYGLAAAGPRIIENFLDFTHLPCVHEGILGTRDRAEVADYEVEVGPGGITAREIYTWTPDPDGSGHAQMAKWLYRGLRPLTAYIELTPADSDSERYVMLFSVTPVSESESIGWMWNSMGILIFWPLTVIYRLKWKAKTMSFTSDKLLSYSSMMVMVFSTFSQGMKAAFLGSQL